MPRWLWRKYEGRKKLGELTETDKARLGMAVDTDGSILCKKSKDRSYSYPVFSFKSATKLALILAKEYGGGIYPKKDKRYPNSHSYEWSISRQADLTEFFEQIKDSILIKEKQRRWALEILELLHFKPAGWKKKTNTLAQKISKQNRQSNNQELDLDDDE